MSVESLESDREGRVWVGTGRGVMWFVGRQPAGNFGAFGLPTNDVRAAYQTRDGAMWFGTWKAGAVRWRSADFQSAVSQVSNLPIAR